MKLSALLLLLVTVVACDPYGFGFKKNPAYVLDEVLKSIKNKDVVSFLELSGREALCLYGNEEGLGYLNDNISFDVKDLDLRSRVVSEGPTPNPEFVGFWSYYRERYQINVSQKESKELMGKIVIDCHYGVGVKKDPALAYSEEDYKTDLSNNPGKVKSKKKKFKVKECRLMKFVPVSFSGLPLPAKCNSLRVDL